MAGKYKIRCEQGATLRRSFTVASEGTATPVPWDLTGYTARMQVRTAVASTDVLLEANTTNGRIEIDPGADGTFSLVLTATETAALTPGAFVYDLELEAPSGDVTRLLQGAFVVLAEVTR